MNNETLDPKDWDKVRALGHEMMDDVINLLQNIREQPVWKPIPTGTKDFLRQSLPTTGLEGKEVYREFKEHIFPYTKGNIHPRFWAWVQGTGTPMGVFADFLASAMNPNATIGEQSAMYVDEQVINWCKEMLHFPKEGSGILLSGGSMANTTALIVARNHMIPNVRNEGIFSLERQPIMYCSAETHSCVIKAAEVIGIGTKGLRIIPVDDKYQIDISELEAQIKADLESNKFPFCIVGNCGTVNTGAVDDLSALRKIADKYKLWLHIDGAFGALAKLSSKFELRLKPIEQADSVAFDLHKWLYMPYEVGCVLIKDQKAHRDSFAITPKYLLNHERGLASGPDSINNYGIELSRGFKALKIWMSIKEQGITKYAEQIEKNIDQAFYLGQEVESRDALELLTPVTMNIVCFRYKFTNKDIDKQNELNKEILMSLQEQGIASPSSTILHGKYAIRVAITNQRSKKEDFDLLVTSVLRLGRELDVLE